MMYVGDPDHRHWQFGREGGGGGDREIGLMVDGLGLGSVARVSVYWTL